MDPGEECDDGNSWDDDDCRNNCHIAFCGDGIVNMRGRRKEECDDEGESASCNINCTRARCGDGLVNGKAGEQCDDANGEDSDGCISDTCRLARCGDGFIYEGRETCDDGNSLSCGTCDATCLVEQGAERASGTITAVSGNQIRDGEIFSLSDGQTRRVFEFKKQGKAPDSHVTVEVRGNYSPGMVARAIGEAITQAFGDSLTVEPTEREETLVVRVNQPGAHANLPIFESVGDEVFTVEGLHGGAGHDCPDGTGCQSDDDCEHGLLCRAPPGQKKRTCRLPPPPP
jgi:cysteine-rich repeat protein